MNFTKTVGAGDVRLSGLVEEAGSRGVEVVRVDDTCAVQGAVPALGFGGIGRSGRGRHHGVGGFREFSDPRGVVRRGRDDLIDVVFPPYGDALDGVVASVLGTAETGDAR
ncbi:MULTISPECIES: hypothetical protein [unclassified Streptomyces]|uniref:hypothetical protein n=1 Tax=unclassified Streptomyces TaxID=2593676 RepID=UPI0035D90517